MSDLKWLDACSGQTVDQLLSLEGEYRLDSLVLAFEQALDQRIEREGSDIPLLSGPHQPRNSGARSRMSPLRVIRPSDVLGRDGNDAARG
jgi:hypothetical protein